MIKTFQINVDQSVLDDMVSRIAATRWTDETEPSSPETGISKRYLQELCGYWSAGFDWRKQEQMLNQFQHFTTDIQGTGLHFIHQKGAGQQSFPLLLTHGWPDSFVRFLKIIPLLTEADEEGFSFDVIVPSIPGHGFSEIPAKSGMNNKKIAAIFYELVTERLGYKKFFAHGGDAGSEITEQLALYHADDLLGIHLTDIPYHHIIVANEDKLSPEELTYKEEITKWQQKEGAYNMIQSTKPQTLAVGINDSPAGLAAWIVEKFQSWSDCDGKVENCFTKDELLTNITIYWVTQTIHSSFRRYHETMKDMVQEMFNPLQKINPFSKAGQKTDVKTGVAQFKTDLLPPEKFAGKFFNIQQWTRMPRGGHFAAMEQPALLAADIRAYAKKMMQV